MEQLIKFNTKEGEKELNLFSIIEESDMFAPDKTRPNFKVMKYDGCKKLADFFWVVIKDTPLFLTQPTADNKNQHVWAGFLGFKGDSDRDYWVFSEGEASQFNTNPIGADDNGRPVLNSKNIDWQFKSNMAYKRFFCRGVFKILGMYWLYADIESPSFATNGDSISDYGSL